MLKSLALVDVTLVISSQVSAIAVDMQKKGQESLKANLSLIVFMMVGDYEGKLDSDKICQAPSWITGSTLPLYSRDAINASIYQAERD